MSFPPCVFLILLYGIDQFLSTGIDRFFENNFQVTSALKRAIMIPMLELVAYLFLAGILLFLALYFWGYKIKAWLVFLLSFLAFLLVSTPFLLLLYYFFLFYQL